MNSLLCESPERTKVNRELIARGVGANGYDAHTKWLCDKEDIYLSPRGKLSSTMYKRLYYFVSVPANKSLVAYMF